MRAPPFEAVKLRVSLLLAAILIGLAIAPDAQAQPAGVVGPPTPLLDATHPVDWVFAYKFNASSFPTTRQLTTCKFKGKPRTDALSLKYAVASSSSSALLNGPGLLGTSLDDPVGATFNEIYNGNLYFVAWNDQFDGHPKVAGCGADCDSPWGHLKGILAWDTAGNGIILQVSTPAWPGSGAAYAPRVGDGNTLGCTIKNNVKFAQHFFALKLSPSDTAAVLDALVNASAPADIHNPQIARIGGPTDIVTRASHLGTKSQSEAAIDTVLSSGVRLISKPSKLQVPPWQLVSARLGGVPLRTASWAGSPFIRTTTNNSVIGCWRPELGTPKRVEVALTGRWAGKLIGVSASNSHAKLGFSLDPTKPYTIFGDLNQQGALSGKCDSAQNGRGGLFFILQDRQLYGSMQQLIPDDVALKPMPKKKKARRHARSRPA